MKTKTQNAAILSYLKRGRTLSPLQALDLFGCLRLSARIYDLRHRLKGFGKHEIVDVPHKGKPYSIYKLAIQRTPSKK